MTPEAALQRVRMYPSDQDAWSVLYSHLRQVLLLYVSSLLYTFRIAEGAEDVVHDVLIKFVETWSSKVGAQIQDLKSAESYLKTSCRNLLIDKYRREKRGEDLLRFLTESFMKVYPAETNSFRQLFVAEIISKLPHDCATMVREYIQSDLSPAEMAENKGLSPSAFYARWYRCLARIRENIVQKL